MDLQFKTSPQDACDTTIIENEYHLMIKFTSLKLNDDEIKNVQVLFLYGDMLSKMDVEVPKDDEEGTLNCEPKVYVIHSTPIALAEKFQVVPITFVLVNPENQKIIGSPITMDMKDCFCNSVKCVDFKQQSMRKTYELELNGACVGMISLIFSVTKDIGNSNRYRKFYTESTAERTNLQAQMPK